MWHNLFEVREGDIDGNLNLLPRESLRTLVTGYSSPLSSQFWGILWHTLTACALNLN